MRNDTRIDSFTVGRCEVEIHRDDDCESPRESDCNLGTMACWHRRYSLGDVQPDENSTGYIEGLVSFATQKKIEKLEYCTEQKDYTVAQWDKVDAAIERRKRKLILEDLDENLVVLPLYLYDHGGISMSTGSFSDPWDSGQVGIIHCSLAEARKWAATKEKVGWDHEIPWNDKDKKLTLREIARRALTGEVEEYDRFIRGECYGYTIEVDGEGVDSCWGFIGFEWAKEAATESAKDHSRVAEEEEAEAKIAEEILERESQLAEVWP